MVSEVSSLSVSNSALSPFAYNNILVDLNFVLTDWKSSFYSIDSYMSLNFLIFPVCDHLYWKLLYMHLHSYAGKNVTDIVGVPSTMSIAQGLHHNDC